MAYPHAPRGRGNKDPALLKVSGSVNFSYQRLHDAREIVNEGPDLATRVMAGSLAFDRALSEVRWRAECAGKEPELLRRLQDVAPDLAERVTAGEWSLFKAYEEQEYRERRAAADLKGPRRKWAASVRGVLSFWDQRLLADRKSLEAVLIEWTFIKPARVDAAIDGLVEWIARVKREDD